MLEEQAKNYLGGVLYQGMQDRYSQKYIKYDDGQTKSVTSSQVLSQVQEGYMFVLRSKEDESEC